MALLRQIPDAQYQRMWRENFTHRCTVHPMLGTDEYGAPQYDTPTVEQMCFVSRSRRRFVNAQNDAEIPDYQVHFPGNIQMGIQYKLAEAKDMDGNVLFNEAVVAYLDDSVSSTQGRLEWLVFAKAQ